MHCENIYYMAKDYSVEEQENQMVNEPAVKYNITETGFEEFKCDLRNPRTISEEEIANSFTLEEFKQHMDDFVESTHNHATGCVGHTPVVPRKCSIKDAMCRSMTIDQFSSKLYAMVDEFYNAKS